MVEGIPVQIVYVLAAIFTVLSFVFLKGKASSLFVGHNTFREPAFSQFSLCKAFGVCLSVITAILYIAALIWDICPEWFIYVFWFIIGGDVLIGTIICNLNILIKK
ncbi:MAG: DUF3784 domain-containing protein [Oscillospiraceae bacterium]